MDSRTPQITRIDIERPARALNALRDAGLYLVVIPLSFGVVPVISLTSSSSSTLRLVVSALLLPGIGFAVYAGWRHLSAIDAEAMRIVRWSLAGALLLVLITDAWFLVMAHTATDPVDRRLLPFISIVLLFFGYVPIRGLLAQHRLDKVMIEPFAVSVPEMLRQLSARNRMTRPPLRRTARTTRARAGAAARSLIWLMAGAAPLVFCIYHAPLLGWFALSFWWYSVVRARRHLQISGSHLLSADTRPPIVLLRSFGDDPKQRKYIHFKDLLDLSLENRLSNHFSQFGPFIAVASPQEPLALPGAARIAFADDEWQANVSRYVREAQLIVVLAGRTPGLIWELQQILAHGRTAQLLVLLPEIAFRPEDLAARVAQLRDTFRGTSWEEELDHYDDYSDLKAMLFRADGSMMMVTSHSRSREAYHLAAILGHWIAQHELAP